MAKNKNILFNDFYYGTGAREAFLMLHSNPGQSLQSAMISLENHFHRALKEYEIKLECLVFSKIFLSDIENQKHTLTGSDIFKLLNKSGFSIIGQPPLNSGAVSVLVYFVMPDGNKFKNKIHKIQPDGWQNNLFIEGKNYKLLANSNYQNIGDDSGTQTDEIFRSLSAKLDKYNMTYIDNSIRSWIYVRDIDNNYQGMVEKRKEYFDKYGLNESTRYLASTGIEGKGKDTSTLVSVDMLSIGGLQTEQIERMDALENLPRTIDYGVTFERGLEVKYGCRNHYYISGTASIGPDGKVMYPDNISKQTYRTLENIEALLNKPGAEMKDLMYLIVYLRDINDYNAAKYAIEEKIENKPIVFLWAPVCRPGWLIEIEGLAIRRAKNKFPEFF